MINAIARGVAHALLLLVCLLVAGLVFGLGAVVGQVLGGAAFACARTLSPHLEPQKWGPMFFLGGAMLGAGSALMLLARVAVSEACQHSDATIRGWAQFLDELGRAMRGPGGTST